MRKETKPPWVPKVSDEMDTRNIATEFVNEPAGVTPSPAGSRLRDAMGAANGSPPAFNEFTYTHSSVLDGTTYRVSLAESEAEESLCRDGFAPPAGSARHDSNHSRTSVGGKADSDDEGAPPQHRDGSGGHGDVLGPMV